MANRVSKVNNEVILEGTGANARVSKVNVEVATHAPEANVRVSKLGVEVLQSVAPTPPVGAERVWGTIIG